MSLNLNNQTKTENQKSLLGIKGELIALEQLTTLGYKCIEKNWRYKHKEIDIICLKDNKIVFVEVKTRSNRYFEPPSDAITIKKQRLLIDAANQYIIQKQIDLEARFDIVSVIIEPSITDVEVIENAFYPLLRRR